MKHSEALKVAESLVEHFRPACGRIEIKGSIARQKPEVKDIDLLVIPNIGPVSRARLEFGKPIPKLFKTMLDKMIDEMVQDGAVQLTTSGDRKKVLYLKYAGIHAEIYCVLPPATWGVRSVIKTGPSDFSHWMVTRQILGGALPDTYYVKDGAVWDGTNGARFETPEEVDYFRLCGLDWMEPKDRVARWNK